jgi:hypothetical protein
MLELIFMGGMVVSISILYYLLEPEINISNPIV